MKKTEVIKELQKQAKEIYELKQKRRQKRPIVIEFCGSPKAGKTSCINSLELFLKRNGFTVKTIQERASVCPVSDKKSPMFNIWTACMSLSGMLGTLEDKSNKIDVLILDRGIFDSLCWFRWLVQKGKMERNQQKKLEDFLLMDELVKPIDIVFAFVADPQVSIDREYTALLTDKMGTIMNPTVLDEYRVALEETIRDKEQYFHFIEKIDTSKKEQDDVGKEVTQYTLKKLRELLMEKIGYFAITDEVRGVLHKKSYIENYELVGKLGTICFGMRNDIEKDERYIQPIPIAVITNLRHDKVLVIKKQQKAVSRNSPEKDRLLVYVGGHSRFEDAIEKSFEDFLTTCRSTLKREVKEEIGISVALDEIEPFFIYDNSSEISRKHLAVCFVVEQDFNELKLRIDTDELISKRGTSISGTFQDLEELKMQEDALENWSKTILKYKFDVDFDDNKQMTIFEKV